MQIPSQQQAQELLTWAQESNPGPWVQHSHVTAQAAFEISSHIPGLDADRAYILGLLHDIGRWSGVSDMRHIMDGYRLMMKFGYRDAARVCLTHSFQIQDVRSMNHNWDGNAEDMAFIENFLAETKYDDYDLLIQLCDALSLPVGYCLIEKRIVDVALRRGIHEFTLPKWEAIFSIQRMFEEKIGRSIYSVLPGVVKNTFGVEIYG